MFVTRSLQNLVHRSVVLTVGIKYLLLVLLVLPVFLSHTHVRFLSLIPVLILVIMVILYFSRFTWQNQLLQGCIYFSGFFLVLMLENYGRDEFLFGFPLHVVSHILFLILMVLVGIKTLLRRRVSRLIVSPFEYLIMLVVLSVPLLPQAVSGQFYLLTVAAKSVVMFVAFKLVLMKRTQRNRKILLAIVLSVLVLVVRRVLAH